MKVPLDDGRSVSRIGVSSHRRFIQSGGLLAAALAGTAAQAGPAVAPRQGGGNASAEQPAAAPLPNAGGPILSAPKLPNGAMIRPAVSGSSG